MMGFQEYPDHFEVWCAPCEQRLTFAQDGDALRAHAHRHAVPVYYTDADGFFIGEPRERESITQDEIIDLEETSLDAWTAEMHRAVHGQDIRTTIMASS